MMDAYEQLLAHREGLTPFPTKIWMKTCVDTFVSLIQHCAGGSGQGHYARKQN